MAALLPKSMASRVISDEIPIMDMTWATTVSIPWSEVAQGPWALFTPPDQRASNIPAFTGAYGFIPEANCRDNIRRR